MRPSGLPNACPLINRYQNNQKNMQSRLNQTHSRYSSSSLKSLRLGSYHFLINIALMILGLGLMVDSLIHRNFLWLEAGLAITAFWLLSVCFFHLSRTSTCPECLARTWRKRAHRKHPRAKRFIGLSHRLTIAIATISHKNYHCPDCGEVISTNKTRD